MILVRARGGMGKSYIIMRDNLVLEKVFDESEQQEAISHYNYLRDGRYQHTFTMKLVDDKEVLKPMLNCIDKPEYQNAIGGREYNQ